MIQYKPLRIHQHGDLNCGNILIDVHNSLWLIDCAMADEHALFVDAAKMMSVILFEQFPVPLTIAELRRGGSQKLVDALGASEDEAQDLMSLAEACNWHSKAALVEKVSSSNSTYGSLQRLLQSIEDDSVAEQRAKEACDVIDLLLKPGLDGKQPQLWEIGERQPPSDWPAYAQLALQLCSRVVKMTTELVAECSRREQKTAAFAPDLHAAHFFLPLLTLALCSIRYVQCGAWQKRVAWHAAQRLARALSQLLRQPPLSPPASADRVLATELKFVARLNGGLGQRRLFLLSANEESVDQRLISGNHALVFDEIDQTMLP